MFSQLRRSTQAHETSPIKVPASATSQVEDTAVLVAALEALASGAIPEKSGLTRDVVSAVNAASEKLRAEDLAELERTVTFSMQTSEAMAAVASAAGEVRDMDSHAQTMSAAVEELDSSIRTINQLAAEFGIHRTTVTGQLDRHGVPRHSEQTAWDDETLKEAAELYAAGASLARVADQFRVDAQTVANRFRRAGVAVRPRRGWTLPAHSEHERC